MGAKHPNGQRIKIHRTYTAEEIARALGIHKQTVRRWEKAGLQPIDAGRPKLFRGSEVRRFLADRRYKARRPCLPGQMYCFRCRAPMEPFEGQVDLLPATEFFARLRGMCSCGALMNRRVSFRTAPDVCPHFQVTMPKAVARIGGTPPPTVNAHLTEKWKVYANAQREE